MRSQDAILKFFIGRKLFPAVIKKSNPLFIEYKLPDLAHTNLSVHCLFVCLFFLFLISFTNEIKHLK